MAGVAEPTHWLRKTIVSYLHERLRKQKRTSRRQNVFSLDGCGSIETQFPTSRKSRMKLGWTNLALKAVVENFPTMVSFIRYERDGDRHTRHGTPKTPNGSCQKNSELEELAAQRGAESNLGGIFLSLVSSVLKNTHSPLRDA